MTVLLHTPAAPLWHQRRRRLILLRPPVPLTGKTMAMNRTVTDSALMLSVITGPASGRCDDSLRKRWSRGSNSARQHHPASASVRRV
jgi:hypothetical protein